MDNEQPGPGTTADDIEAWDQVWAENAVADMVIPVPEHGIVQDRMTGLDTLTIGDFADDHQAFAFYLRNGCTSVRDAFMLGVILRDNARAAEASRFFRVAFDLHAGHDTQYPLPRTLLHARLLCLLKAGLPLPAQEVEELRRICASYARSIESVAKAWREDDPHGALRLMGTSLEAFRSGEEVDALYLSFARNAQFDFTKGGGQQRLIPEQIYSYEEDSSSGHGFGGSDVRVFGKTEAAQWLGDVFGAEARALFLAARETAEASDILRLHIIHALGGWWLDAGLRVENREILLGLMSQTEETVLFLTPGNLVRNDIFGSVAQAPVLTDALFTLYRNSYLHPDLYVPFKTGSGVFTRALNRMIHRDISGVAAMRPTALQDRHVVDMLTGQRNGADLS